jgi:hypothetical protein
MYTKVKGKIISGPEKTSVVKSAEPRPRCSPMTR